MSLKSFKKEKEEEEKKKQFWHGLEPKGISGGILFGSNKFCQEESRVPILIMSNDMLVENLFLSTTADEGIF